jgi:hypothetical protein
MKHLSQFLQSIACLWLAMGFASPAFGGMIINSYQFSSGGGGSTDPYFANVVLLMHCDGSNGSTTYVDNSSYARTITAYNGAALSTSSPKFGTASSLHDGVDDYVEVTASSDFVMGTATDFTIEFWLYADSSQPVSCGIGQGSGSYVVVYGGSLYVGNGAANMIIHSYAGLYDTWTYIAVSRTGSTIKLFINGTSVNTGTNAAWGANSTLLLMRSPVVGSFGKGKIDDLRITKGVGRYNSNFSSPSAAFPDS